MVISKKGDRLVAVGSLALLEQGHEPILFDQVAADLDSLVETNEMRGGVDVGPCARRP